MRCGGDESKALNQAFYDVPIRIVVGVLSSVLNAFTLRFMSIPLIGARARLLLLHGSITNLSLDPILKTCCGIGITDTQSFINTVWSFTPLSFLIASIVAVLWLFFIETDSTIWTGDYKDAVFWIICASISQSLTYPFVIIANVYWLSNLKVSVDALANLSYSLSSFMILYFRWETGLMAFVYARGVYLSVIFLLYFMMIFKEMAKNGIVACPFPTGLSLPSMGNIKLVGTFSQQALIKQILGEAEKYILAYMNLIETAGLYDVVSSLGSIVVRYVFLPVEESAYVFFAKSIPRGKSCVQQHEKVGGDKTLAFLAQTLKLLTLVGITIAVFGQSYSHVLLHIYAGDLLSASVTNLLRLYSVYVLLLAVNGITESFFLSTASVYDIKKNDFRLIILFCLHVFLVFVLSRSFSASSALIIANSVTILVRFAFSFAYICSFYETAGFCTRVALSRSSMCAFGVTFLVCSFSEKCVYRPFTYELVWPALVHVFIGGSMLLVSALTILNSESDVFRYFRRTLTEKTD